MLEANQIHRGVFHVLGGLLSPLEGIAPEDLRIGELVARAQRVQAKAKLLSRLMQVQREMLPLAIYINCSRRMLRFRVPRAACR